MAVFLSGRPKCAVETDTSCRFIVTHGRFYRSMAGPFALHIALFDGHFQKRSAGR